MVVEFVGDEEVLCELAVFETGVPAVVVVGGGGDQRVAVGVGRVEEPGRAVGVVDVLIGQVTDFWVVGALEEAGVGVVVVPPLVGAGQCAFTVGDGYGQTLGLVQVVVPRTSLTYAEPPLWRVEEAGCPLATVSKVQDARVVPPFFSAVLRPRAS